MACENAINATDVLVEHIRTARPGRRVGRRSRPRPSSRTPRSTGSCRRRRRTPAWTSRSRPTSNGPSSGPPFGGNEPTIPDATWVDDLAPYIERKLFTVNTGHATTAYHGFARGINKLSDALADDEVRAAVEGVLAETKQLLVDKHEFAPEAQQAYVDKILQRFANPYLPDTVDRVGRQPLRKLSRTERLIGPAAELAETGIRPEYLLATVEAALSFDVPEDPESVELQQLLQTLAGGGGDRADHRPEAGRPAVRRRARGRWSAGSAVAGARIRLTHVARRPRCEPEQ